MKKFQVYYIVKTLRIKPEIPGRASVDSNCSAGKTPLSSFSYKETIHSIERKMGFVRLAFNCLFLPHWFPFFCVFDFLLASFLTHSHPCILKTEKELRCLDCKCAFMTEIMSWKLSSTSLNRITPRSLSP